MSDVVIVALITGLAAVITGIVTGVVTGSTVIYRIKELEKKVDKHNGLIERMVAVEMSTRSAHHRIDEIKEKVSC